MRIAILFSWCVCAISYGQEDPTKLFKDQSENTDGRLGKLKTLNDYFPMSVPKDLPSWNTRKTQLREQLLVGLGLWPLPEKTPLKPVIHGKMEREGYTVEKVYFASMPGHYVTGNLYRPTAKIDGKRPAILCPHGHWKNGRFYENSADGIKKELASKAEQYEAGAKSPLQARCAQLARMGFVVFFYDMVGNADSTIIPHRAGFTDVQAELRSQNFMGLQVWNSFRAFDFLSELPDVDAKKIGVTGASGGGTQTFMLCALDDRPAAAFPAVMVSTAMQGGCICENCDYLRVGTGNIEIAGLFAPKPMAMSGANDWTIDILTKGLPELKALYKLHGAEDKVAAKCWPEFGHNYNQVAREFMYSWFNQHLLGGSGPVSEKPFVPFSPKELSVYDEQHPRPKDELPAEELRKNMTKSAEAQLAALTPKDEKSLAEFRRVTSTALRVMIGEELPVAGTLAVRQGPKEVKLPDGVTMHLAAFGRKDEKDKIVMAGLFTAKMKDKAIIWVSNKGKASLFDKGVIHPTAKKLLDEGYAIVAPDVFQTGEISSSKPYPVDKTFAGYTFGYNRSVFAHRVHDINTAIMFARDMLKAKSIDLIGWDGAGPWVAATRALAGNVIRKTVIDLNQFRFENISDIQDENLLPGIVKIGGMPTLLALCSPNAIYTHNHQGTHTGELPKAAYGSAKALEQLQRKPEKATDAEIVAYLLAK